MVGSSAPSFSRWLAGCRACAALVVAGSPILPAIAQQAPLAQSAPAPIAPVTSPAPDVAVAPEAAGTPATVIDEQQIESVLGKSVRSPTGDDLGHIVDILSDKTGALRAAVIDFGGFFGVGSRKIAVDWRSLRFGAGAKGDTIVIELPVKQLRMSPVYKDGEPVVILGKTAAPVSADPAAPSASTTAPK